MEGLNILLIHPRMANNRLQKKTFPLGLASLAAYWRRRRPNDRIEALDAHILNADDDLVAARLASRRWDVVGVTAWTLQFNQARHVLEMARRIAPKAMTVIGGVHVSMKPEDGLEVADRVIVSEGEQSFLSCVEDSSSERMVRPKSFIDLDSMPFPAWDLFPMEKYDYPLHVQKMPRIPIMGSRGCPYNCSFCSSPSIWQRKVRYRSGESVAEEMFEANRRFGFKGVHFWDDSIMLNERYVTGLCDAIGARNLDMKWVALSRADHVIRNRHLLPAMSRAGCIGMEMGLEAFDDSIYAQVGKNQNRTEILEAIDCLTSNGIVPLFTFMTFMPGETLTTARNISRFFQDIRPQQQKIQTGGTGDWPICIGQFTTPHVNTPFAAGAGREGLDLGCGYDDRHHHNINWLPWSFLSDVPRLTGSALTPEMEAKIRNKKRLLWKEFYDDQNPAELIILARRILSSVDGRRTVREIIDPICDGLNGESNRTFRLSAFVIYCLAQLDVLASAGRRP